MSRTVVLTRITREKDGIFGILSVESEVCCLTLEHQDKSINAGAYKLTRDHTGRHRFYKVEDRDGRTNIEIHKGNTNHDTTGCVLVGSYIGNLGGVKSIMRSSDAADRLLAMLGDEDATLIIRNLFV